MFRKRLAAVACGFLLSVSAAAAPGVRLVSGPDYVPFADPSLPSGGLAGALVQVTAPGATPLDGFLILLHSASSPKAAEIGREWIARGHQSTLEQALVGPRAAERAGLFLALVAGLQAMRQMVQVPALAEADPAVLERLLVPMIRVLLESTNGM